MTTQVKDPEIEVAVEVLEDFLSLVPRVISELQAESLRTFVSTAC